MKIKVVCVLKFKSDFTVISIEKKMRFKIGQLNKYIKTIKYNKQWCETIKIRKIPDHYWRRYIQHEHSLCTLEYYQESGDGSDKIRKFKNVQNNVSTNN